MGDRSGPQSIQGGSNPGTPPGGIAGDPSHSAALPSPKSREAKTWRDGRPEEWKIVFTTLSSFRTPSPPPFRNDSPSSDSMMNKNRLADV